MIPRQSYAPTPHSYVPNTSLSATINLDEEAKLTDNRAERDLQDSLAELFSIIVTIDELEKAFLKDAVPEAEYKEICERLLRQYKALLADETIAKEFQGIDEFKAKWDLEVPRATERIRVGIPIVDATAIPASLPPTQPATAVGGGGGGGGGSVLILEATEAFVTFFDAIQLGMLAKDQLHPLLSEVIQAVNKRSNSDFESRGKIVQWLITLNQMKATEELSENQARELNHDIRQAYDGFRQTLT